MTEKNYNPKQKERKAMTRQKDVEQNIDIAKIKKEDKEKIESKTEENKKEIIKKPEKKVLKKTYAIVKASNLPISTKVSASICKFIKGKKIESAISDLNQVLLYKKAVPMKGEIPHRKGKIMSGRYPKKAVEYFIKLLKSLSSNANINDLNNPVIVEAVSNIGSRPFGRFGRIRKKRTHVEIKAIEKKIKEKKK